MELLNTIDEMFTLFSVLTILASPFILVKSFMLYRKNRKEEQLKRSRELEEATIRARQEAKWDEELYLEKLRRDRELEKEEQKRQIEEVRRKEKQEYLDQLYLDFHRKAEELEKISDPEEYERRCEELLSTHPFITYHTYDE